DAPARRRRARQQQEIEAALGGEGVEMEQRLLRRALGVIDDGGRRRSRELARRRPAEPLGREKNGAGPALEDMGEMGLAAARGAGEDKRRRGPARPAVEPSDRLG